MKEVWVKVTAWKRHLVEDEEIKEVEDLIKNATEDSEYKNIIDTYDKNDKEQYDSERLHINEFGSSYQID